MVPFLHIVLKLCGRSGSVSGRVLGKLFLIIVIHLLGVIDHLLSRLIKFDFTLFLGQSFSLILSLLILNHLNLVLSLVEAISHEGLHIGVIDEICGVGRCKIRITLESLPHFLNIVII